MSGNGPKGATKKSFLLLCERSPWQSSHLRKTKGPVLFCHLEDIANKIIFLIYTFVQLSILQKWVNLGMVKNQLCSLGDSTKEGCTSGATTLQLSQKKFSLPLGPPGFTLHPTVMRWMSACSWKCPVSYCTASFSDTIILWLLSMFSCKFGQKKKSVRKFGR